MNFLKIGAIDIGSNGIRLFIANVLEDSEQTTVYKESIHRIPLRLGEDVFTSGLVSELKKINLIKVMQAFKLLMEVEQLKIYRVCATSALREASNADAIVADVKRFAGLNIDIISCEEESSLLFQSRKLSFLKPKHDYLYIDLGGGSLDITFFNLNQNIESASFKLGTIRILKGLSSQDEFERLKKWLLNIINKSNKIQLIGSGGNINKIFKKANVEKDNPLSLRKIQKIRKELLSHNFNERMKFMELNSDRADVILPATELFISIMQWTNIDEITVPIVGLCDGIVANEYLKYIAENKKSNVKPLEINSNQSEY